MKKDDFKKALKKAQFHGGVLVRGLVRTLFGALNACLIAAAVYGFVLIQEEGGYTAVFEFIGACALVMIALANAYLLGCKKRGAKR
jgi:hypothetical protein